MEVRRDAWSENLQDLVNDGAAGRDGFTPERTERKTMSLDS